MTTPLMPKATAVWLIDNTALTFDQIADFCGLHPLEVQGIADGEVAAGIRGADPVTNGQLERVEIEKAEKDATYRMALIEPPEEMKRKKAPKSRYTPVSRRQDRPDAIAWILRSHPEMSDAQISRLLGTTKPTIQSIRDRSHWNSANLQPRDPVTLGLCTQIELDKAVALAAERKSKLDAKKGPIDEGPTLKPVDDAIPSTDPSLEPEVAGDAGDHPADDAGADLDPESVFGGR